MCICQSCGEKYKIDLLISDDLWEKIKPINKPVRAGLLCGGCIMKRLERILDYSTFKLKEI